MSRNAALLTQIPRAAQRNIPLYLSKTHEQSAGSRSRIIITRPFHCASNDHPAGPVQRTPPPHSQPAQPQHQNPPHQPAKILRALFLFSKARRPAGSAVWCCETQIGRSVICQSGRSVRTGVRACVRVLLSPSPAVGQASKQAGTQQREFSFASPPLPQSQFRVLRSGREI